RPTPRPPPARRSRAPRRTPAGPRPGRTGGSCSGPGLARRDLVLATARTPERPPRAEAAGRTGNAAAAKSVSRAARPGAAAPGPGRRPSPSPARQLVCRHVGPPKQREELSQWWTSASCVLVDSENQDNPTVTRLTGPSGGRGPRAPPSPRPGVGAPRPSRG